jgi:hypothetical protein|nr:SRPBCC family protein [Caldimonas sp.]
MLTVAIVVVIAVVVVLALAAMRPGSFAVQRSAEMRAPAGAIYPLIADFREWPRWSPWERLDPGMKRTLSGAESGTGAVYAWEGSSKVGAGRMEIRDVAPPSKVVIQLDFIKPFEGHNVTEFALVPKGDATDVQWTMRGPATFVMKLMGLFMNMDRMIGRDFERGLANLKSTVEQR